MAKSGKFSALAEFRQVPIDEQAEPPAAAASSEPAPQVIVPATVIEPPKVRGRPPGKRSNPDWKLYSHFLKRKTQRRAAAVLAEFDDGRDLSDVLQELLETWLVEREKRISKR